MACDMCDESREAGMRFCPHCGQPLADDIVPKGEPKPFLKTVVAWTTAVVMALLAFETLFLIIGAPDVFDWCQYHAMDVLVLIPNLVTACTISGKALQLAWVLIFAAAVAAIAMVIWRTYRQISDGRGEPDCIERTDAYGMSRLFAASIALSVISSIVLMSFGSGIDVPEDLPVGSESSAILSFTNAAVWEEIIARVAYIGLPMTIIAAVCRKGRDSLRFLLGGFGLSKAAIVLIVVSSLIFGFGHMSGWGLEKVLPTTLSGLIMGYAYVRYGIHVSIGIHFLTDFLGVLAGPDTLTLAAIFIMAVMVLGILCLIDLLIGLNRSLDGVRDLPNWVPDRDSSASRRDSD